MGTDEAQNAGAPGLGTGNNTGLWSLLTAASKYNAFEVEEEEDDDSVRCLLFNVLGEPSSSLPASISLRAPDLASIAGFRRSLSRRPLSFL